MRIVSKSEAIDWLVLRGISNPTGKIINANFPRYAEYHLTADSGRKTAMARSLAYQLTKHHEAILWVNEWGIWDPCENWPLFYGYRQSIGETRPIEEAPGHIFVPSDEEIAFSLLSMVLYFIWGAVFASSSGEVIRISHDEYIEVYSKASTQSEDDIFQVADWIVKEHKE